MPLSSGERLDHYEILAPLGAGGMGEVYRATDSKLKREVAIKVLPTHFAADSGRLMRFQREAQLLASLNHSNIAAIHGLEHVRGVHFLVMELVEGETIAERLASRPMEVSEALRFAVQIADALQSAHDKGVIHRDLKPANVKITPDGRIKVLDFGLAKALGDEDRPIPADPSNSPTITVEDTHAGVILGTAPYMSPEQASGHPVDRRSDIWSFGVLLYEMLSGRRAFTGKTTSHILVKVLEYEPDWSALPPLPAGVQDLIERCLQKEPENRLRDIGDIRVLLQSSITKPVSIKQPREVRSAQRWLWPSLAAILALLLLSYIYLRPAPPAPLQEAMRFEIAQPNDSTPSPYVRVSPDGTKVAFIARAPQGLAQIWVRPLRDFNSRPLQGTENVQGIPFWTHDSRYIVFTSQGKLRKIEASGGPSQFLGDEPVVLHGFSTVQGDLIFGTPNSGIRKVPAGGGTPIPFGDSPVMRGGSLPSPLPNGKDFLFAIYNNVASSFPTGIYVGSLDGGEPRRILSDASPAVYSPSPNSDDGHILFVRGGTGVSSTLMAQRFDVQKLTVTGEAFPVAENVPVQGFSTSNTGVLVHGTGGSAVPTGIPGVIQGRLNWLDLNGKNAGALGQSGFYRIPAISTDADGKYVAVETYGGSSAHLEVLEIERGISTRFTFEGNAYDPVWSPKGDRLVYAAQHPEGFTWFVKNADRSGQDELVIRLPKAVTPHSWSPDGRFLLGNDAFPPAEIYAVDLQSPLGDRKLIPVFNGASRSTELHARFSPDGNWFAYASDESSTFEIYVRPWDAKTGQTGSGGLTQVSKGGARAGGAVWRRDGKELYYLAIDGTMMAVTITPGATISVETPRPLFKIDAPSLAFFDVSADGKKFIMPLPEKPVAMMAPFKVVVNWTSTLKR